MVKKIFKQNSSFGVLRANPKISGNVKISTDSKGDIWLNSIDSNEEMSKSQYKAFRISPDSSYNLDLYNFFNKGETPTDFVFGIKNEISPQKTQVSDPDLSYDFTYATGVEPLISDKYEEDFRYLAPLWMGGEIPEYFVIFRVSDPIDYSYSIPVSFLIPGQVYKVVQDIDVDINAPGYVPYSITNGANTYSDGDVFTATSSTTFTVNGGIGNVILLDPLYNLSNVENPSNHFLDKILPKATIVATFDMGENSKLGKYLRKIKNSRGYSESMIDVKFEENLLTTFNGVNYQRGIFDKKGEYFYDYAANPKSQIEFEEYVTNGFQRNGILGTKLLNLEFLFDDEQSNLFSINRYFGLYVNAVDLGGFKLDGNALYRDNGNSGNTPVPNMNNSGYYQSAEDYYQYNENGVRLFLDQDEKSGFIPSSDDVNILEDSKLFYVLDKNGQFHSLKRDVDYSASSPSPFHSSYGITGLENQLVLQDTKVNLADFTGGDPKTRKQYPASQTDEKGRAHFVIRFEGQLSNINQDCFVFYHPLGSQGIPGEKYDIFLASDMSSIVDEWGPGSYYSQPGAYYYHPFGTGNDLARSISGLLNSFNYNSFEAFADGNEAVVRIKATGDRQNRLYAFDFYQNFSTLTRIPDSRRGIVFFNEDDVADLNSKRNFIGGSNYPKIRIKMKLEDSRKMIPNKTYIETDLGISKVSGVYRFVDQYIQKDGDILGLKDFKTHATVELSDFTHKVAFGEGLISAYEIYEIQVGTFSFLGLRESDVDFWSSNYGYTPTEEYYKYLDVQSDGKTAVVPGVTYYVSPGTVISYNSTTITGPDFFEGIVGVEAYTLITQSTTSEVGVIPTRFTRNTPNQVSIIPPASFDGNIYPDLDKFPGFYGIQDFKFYDDSLGITRKFDQMFFGKLNTEYEYTKDNYLKEYALKSRIEPYITKWGFNGGIDARGNEYRLNANLAFSPLNFSPSFFRRIQDPKYFTHEWYTLQTPPELLPEENIHKDKSYGSSPFSLNNIKNADPNGPDYFIDYFIQEGEDFTAFYPNSTTIQNVNLTERFTFIRFNEESGFCETLFRGARIKFKRRLENYTGEEGAKFFADDKFFEGYKFSAVLKVIENIDDKIQSPVKLRIVENQTFKTITFIVEVLIDELRAENLYSGGPASMGALDYFLLYSLTDKLKMSDVSYSSPSFIQLPVIGDVKLSCGLNISAFPTTGGLVSNVNTGTPLDNGKIYIVENPDYDVDLREEILLVYPKTTLSSTVSPTGPGSFYGIPSFSGAYTLPWPTGVQQDVLNFRETDGLYFFDFSAIGFFAPQNVPVSASYSAISQIPIYQVEGGLEHMKPLMEKLSFASISIQTNTENPFIEYTTCVWDEASQSTNQLPNKFNLEFSSPSLIEQSSYVIPRLDANKPSELNLQDIGYVLDQISAKTELYRYSGGYNPIFREILKFERIKSDSIASYAPDGTTFSVKFEVKTEENELYNLGSNSCFWINGIEADEIDLIRGNTYFFDLSDPSNIGNLIYFSDSDIGARISGSNITYGYTTSGIPGNPSSYISFYVGYNLPDQIYYVSSGSKYAGGKINIIDPLHYAQTSFGPYKDDFGIVKNVNYNKYSKNYIFTISQNSGYQLVYPLVNQTPIDRRDLSLFLSSWDPGFIREYTNSTNYNPLPGTRSMNETKTFFGSKIMKTPEIFTQSKQVLYPTSVTDVLNQDPLNFPGYEIIFEETDTEIRGIALLDRMLVRFFNENGADRIFKKIIIPEFGFGSQSTVTDDIEEYISKNIVQTYEAKELKAYIRRISIANAATNPYGAIVSNLADYEKVVNGFIPTSDARFVKRTEQTYEFYFTKDPSFDYSLAFSFQIGKI